MIEYFGRLHPFLVHFPVALVLVAAVAEALYVARRVPGYADAARFMLIAAAWISFPVMLSGFAAATGEDFTDLEQHAFSIHRIAGIAVPCLVFLATGLALGARRSGQIWELMLYRLVLAAAVAGAVVAGLYGGVLGHGPLP